MESWLSRRPAPKSEVAVGLRLFAIGCNGSRGARATHFDQQTRPYTSLANQREAALALALRAQIVHPASPDKPTASSTSEPGPLPEGFTGALSTAAAGTPLIERSLGLEPCGPCEPFNAPLAPSLPIVASSIGSDPRPEGPSIGFVEVTDAPFPELGVTEVSFGAEGGAAVVEVVVEVSTPRIVEMLTKAGAPPVPNRQPSTSPSRTVVLPAPTFEYLNDDVPDGDR